MSPKQLVLACTLAFGLPAWASSPTPKEDLLGQTVFQVILGEIALREGAVELSLDAWTDLAQRSMDPKAFARAVEIAGHSGDHARALHLVRLWLSVEPQSRQAQQTQLALLIQARQTEQLAPHLRRLLEASDKELPQHVMLLNRMLARIPDKAAILTLLEQVLADHQQLPEAHFVLAQAALAAGDNDRATQELQSALQLRPDWEQAAIAHASLQARQNAGQAIEAMQQFITRKPDSRDARQALAQFLVTEKRYPEAREQYTILLQASPDEPAILYPAAVLALQTGDRENGRLQLEKLLRTNFPDKSTLHFFLGQIALEDKDTETALTHFQQVTAGERFIAARARAASLLGEQGKTDSAIELLRNTRGVTPAEQSQLAQAEAQLLRDTGQPHEAYQALERALKSQPDNPELLYDAALSAERIQQYDTMERHLRTLLDKHPAHPHALNALGYSLAERNIRLDEAEQLLQKAITLAPEDPFILDSVGWLQYRQGKLEQALKTLQQAYQLKADAEIAAHLGEVLWKMQRHDEARKIWQEASEKSPDNAALKATRQKFQP